MKKLGILFGKESIWLMGITVFAFCFEIMLSVCKIQIEWISTICWSVVSAAIVYFVTVMMPRYSAQKYLVCCLLRRVNKLLCFGRYFFDNICLANNPFKRIPSDLEIEDACRYLDLKLPPLRMLNLYGREPNWWNLLSDCKSSIENDVHEIIMLNNLPNIELSTMVDDLQTAFSELILPFAMVLDTKNSVLPCEKLKELAALFRKLEEYAEIFGSHER